LRRKLGALDAWVTGQRRDQSLQTRTDLRVLERGFVFSTENALLLRVNPLAQWSSGQVWDYIRTNDVSYNELHERGYMISGCEPCTRREGM